jgi:hypothetical protein
MLREILAFSVIDGSTRCFEIMILGGHGRV